MANFLTAKQQRVLDIIEDYISKNDRSPTLNELQIILDIKSKRGVVKHLDALEKKGYINRTSEPRGIRLITDQNLNTLNIPIYGYANAGKPLVIAEEDIVGSIKVDKSIINNQQDKFALIVKGDSMNMRTVNKIKIMNGNYLIVDKGAEYRDGDVVLAVVDNAATVKTFKRSENSVILYPESDNPVHTPIYLREDSDGFINGKVIAVLENPMDN